MVFPRKGFRKRIALFGGSFNPPHIGHTAICKWLFARGIVDEIWIIPCFIHPFGKELLPFEDRISMCRLAFNKLGLNVKVLDVEQKLGGVSFTKRTIEHLKKLNPDFRFMLVTGDDIQGETSSWQGYDVIRDLVEIIRIPRGPNSPIPDVSSTEIRKIISERKKYADLVEKEIAVYIITKNLFK